MEKSVHYKNNQERKTLIAENEALRLRMLHDTFDAGWQPGQEPSGTMIFTDVQPEAPLPGRDIAAEVDELKAKVLALEAK